MDVSKRQLFINCNYSDEDCFHCVNGTHVPSDKPEKECKNHLVSGFPTDPNLKVRPICFIEIFKKKSTNEMFTYNKNMHQYGLESTKKK